MIKPDYKDEANDIEMYQGDAIQVLPQLLEKYEGKANLLLSDPPYGIAYVSNHRTHKDIMGQAIANDEDLDVVQHAVPYIDKLLADNSALYFFGHPNMVGETRAILDPVWKYKNLIVWDKGDAGTFGDLEAGYSLNYEVVFYYNKGRRILNGSRPRTILRYNYETSELRVPSEIEPDEYLASIEYLIHALPEDVREETLKKLPDDIISNSMRQYPKAQIRVDWSSRNDPVHPTAKPVSLMELLIKYSTNRGDLVIDPFMGTSPVGAACKKLGRKFIGIEMRPEFFRIAQNRVSMMKKDSLIDSLLG